MNNILKISIAAIIAVTLVACGAGAKDKKGDIGDMKVKLEKLKKEKNEIDADIRKLEDQISKADPKAAQQARKLVSIDTLRIQDFTHFIELQGKIDAEGMAYVAPTGQGGLIKAVYVKAGQKVGKGQLILKLDDAMARQSVVAAQQQTGVLKARLAQAQTVYERYQNLWKQNIGAEIQVINAKADVDALQSQLRAAQAQVGMAQEQANMSNVYAGISGTIEEMNVKVGEFFSPQSAAMPGAGIRIVNNSNLKIVTNVPENYVTRVKKGDKVEVVVPESNKPPFQSVISVVGGSIDPTTRSFTTEAKLPSDPTLKPNQTATLKILDYEAKAAVAVPVNVVQSDEKGKYVYVVERTGDKLVARKKIVTVGEAYNGIIEIKTGLTGGDLIITEGYQTVYDGQSVATGK
ncbi:MAG: efflux RND transporter periplasmic adaptor subunit [Chitinophagaceae bacterium]|nr:efflux RND transporter periplasmic adaptor subunit [Chitinophagaceae bacterium]MBK9939994.1 efflux RND transporter periplasmic adaptor subunit [Chitinophagaceae bacterium]MBP6233888.1 efflux RND transporter periplasmic adaptor subunit [Chitinophagaceae bacterium]MBP6416195.1 efflux RND transporter periplasmic adaptor subunit [Chitinophagaceae bacterium]